MTTFTEALRRLLPVRGNFAPISASGRRAQRVPEAPTQKGSRAGPLIAYENLGQPVWSPRDYGAFAREGFMQNAIVYRSVRMVAEAAASIPLLLYEDGVEVTSHPLLDLMRQPSLDHTGPDFLESWFGFLLVAGNAYVEAVALDGEVRELHVLRPDRVKVIAGNDGWPEGYDYTVGGQTVRLTGDVVTGVRPVLHTRLFHPVNDHYGMSPIEAAAVAIDIHNTASGWNKALLDNSARPSGALVYAAANGQMTEQQFARLKSELETSFEGARNAGRPLLLEGGLDWKPLSLSPKDMDFMEAKNGAAREIALAIGVPPMLLGIPGDNTFSNYQEAQRAFWRQTVLPLVNRMTQGFSKWLAPGFSFAPGDSPSSSRPPGAGVLELRPDLDQVEALAPERGELWARLQSVTFLTDDEKRAVIGYESVSPAPGDSPSLALGDSAARSRPPSAGVGFSSAPSDSAAGSRPEGAGAVKYNHNHDELGRFTFADGAGGGGPGGSLTGGPSSVGLGGNGKEPGKPTDGQTRVAQAGGRRPGAGTINIGGQTFEATPGQAMRFANASNAAEAAVARVREVDPNWRPTPGLSGNVEGAIAQQEAVARQAEARLREIERTGIGGNGGPPLPPTGPTGTRLPGSTARPIPAGPDPNLPEFLQQTPGKGSVTGSPKALAQLKDHERAFYDELAALGNHVEVIDTGTDPTADIRINGKRYELKTVTNIVDQTEEGLSKSISSTIVRARSQAADIVIDARKQPGMTLEAAQRAVNRAYSKDTQEGAKIQSITILTRRGPLYAPRRK